MIGKLGITKKTFFLTQTCIIFFQSYNNIIISTEEVDDYEYGAVNAPIGIAVGAGVLAILTALLPVVLQGGEEAFEEMRQSDEGKWGSGNSDRLNGRR